MNPVTPTFDFIYGYLLFWLLKHGHEELNVRTGHRVKSGRGGAAFRLDLSAGILPTPGLRKTFPGAAAAEIAWYLTGSRDVTWLRKYASFWDKFVEDDGTTIANAYGYRWRKHFGRDQIALAIEALVRNPSDRRVYVSAWDPAEDGLGAAGQKNVPCPAAFTFSVVDGELHSSLFIRSSDVFVGLPYDVMGHALLMDAVAQDTATRPGVMTVTLAHPHLYEDHWEMAEECLAQVPVVPEVPLPGWSALRIAREPDAYVALVKDLASERNWPTYCPRPEVVE